jgi:hypothetical protein
MNAADSTQNATVLTVLRGAREYLVTCAHRFVLQHTGSITREHDMTRLVLQSLEREGAELIHERAVQRTQSYVSAMWAP